MSRAARTARRERAETYAPDAADEQRPDPEFQGRGQPVTQVGHDALARPERRAEVALGHVLQVLHVLFGQGAVESPPGLRRVDDLLVSELALAHDRGERVGRNES
jgi:hypothetical protein